MKAYTHRNKYLVVAGALLCLVFFYTVQAAENNPIITQAQLELSAAERDWLAEHSRIRIAPDSQYKPIEYIDNGTYQGITADYYDLIGQMLGVEFILSSKANWSESYQALTRGEVDIVPAIQATPERLKALNFSEPYLFLNSVVITSNSNRQKNLSVDDFNGKKIAAVKGYFWSELLPVDYPNVTIVEVPDMATGLQETALGTVDAFLGSFATSTNYIDERDITNLHVAGKAPYQIEYGSAVRKDWPELIPILNKAFANITAEQHQSIRNRWIALEYEDPLISRRTTFLILGMLALTGLLAFGSLLWSRSLQQQVQQKTRELKQINEQLEFKVYQRTEDLRRAHERLRNRHQSLQDLSLKLEDDANRDELTGIANRRRLDQFLAEALVAAKTKRESLSIAMVDIDYFKLYNDHYGHLIGDDCLREFAKTLHHYAKRSGELAARFGGEEFTLILPGMDKNKSLSYAENLLQAIREMDIEHIKNPDKPYLTASIGLYTYTPDTDTFLAPEKVLEYGDQALYAAKRNGKDQAMHFSDLSV